MITIQTLYLLGFKHCQWHNGARVLSPYFDSSQQLVFFQTSGKPGSDEKLFKNCFEKLLACSSLYTNFLLLCVLRIKRKEKCNISGKTWNALISGSQATAWVKMFVNRIPNVFGDSFKVLIDLYSPKHLPIGCVTLVSWFASQGVGCT